MLWKPTEDIKETFKNLQHSRKIMKLIYVKKGSSKHLEKKVKVDLIFKRFLSLSVEDEKKVV